MTTWYRALRKAQKGRQVLRFRDQIIKNVAVFELTGDVLGGRGLTSLRDAMVRHTRLGAQGILLDLAGVNSMNVQGQKMLIGSVEAIEKAGGRLAITNIENLDSLLAVTQLVTHMDHFDSREEALTALGATETELSAE